MQTIKFQSLFSWTLLQQEKTRYVIQINKGSFNPYFPGLSCNQLRVCRVKDGVLIPVVSILIFLDSPATKMAQRTKGKVYWEFQSLFSWTLLQQFTVSSIQQITVWNFNPYFLRLFCNIMIRIMVTKGLTDFNPCFRRPFCNSKMQ
ncbi:MAG: hypothetical protein C4B56_04655 [Candidatus Methanophagaceae archaeon]|nr:MAG: hypothetical protein C4B56_04655 [Methanophagales archaeon]